MCKIVLNLAAFALFAGCTFDGSAQVYQCGDYYTNKPNQGESCVLVPGASVTVVPPKVANGKSADTSDECAPPLAKSRQGWQPPIEDSLSWRECRDLTDKARNNGKPLTLLQLEQVRAKYARDRDYSLEFVWTSVSASSMQKKVDCMIVSSDIKLCTCLAEELPVSLSYLDYVHIVANPKGSDFSYLKLNPQELSRITGMVWSVRDECIARK